MVHLPPPLEQQYRELEILNAIATALSESVGLAAALGTALSRVAELLHLQAGWVWLLDETTGKPYLAAAQNLPAALADYPERMEGSCYCLATFRRGDLNCAANVFTCSRLEWLTEGTAGLRYHASIPLHARGKRLGVMNVASTEWRELTDCELHILHTIGDMLGVAIERSQLYERSVAAGAAEERNRLAREIHDTLAQGLAATALQLETAEALLEAGAEPERARAAVRRALETTRQNLEDTRRSVLDLRPAPLQGRSLAQALQELCTRSSAEGSQRVRLRTIGEGRALPARLEVGLYRVAQEALANAMRHAAARTISIQLQVEPERVRLAIEDDGRGFEVGGPKIGCSQTGSPMAGGPRGDTGRPPAGGFGLIGICERVRLFGGTFELQSSPGAGTCVAVVVPLT
jgi:two-component system NarL family sensor kinase